MFEALTKSGLRIIYYHIISNSKNYVFFNGYILEIKSFIKQINYLEKRYKIITFKESFRMLKNNEKLDNFLVITTDDGFKENYTVLAPLLLKKGLRHCSFISTDSVDNKSLLWNHRLSVIQKTSSSDLLIFLIDLKGTILR